MGRRLLALCPWCCILIFLLEACRGHLISNQAVAEDNQTENPATYQDDLLLQDLISGDDEYEYNDDAQEDLEMKSDMLKRSGSMRMPKQKLFSLYKQLARGYLGKRTTAEGRFIMKKLAQIYRHLERGWLGKMSHLKHIDLIKIKRSSPPTDQEVEQNKKKIQEKFTNRLRNLVRGSMGKRFGGHIDLKSVPRLYRNLAKAPFGKRAEEKTNTDPKFFHYRQLIRGSFGKKRSQENRIHNKLLSKYRHIIKGSMGKREDDTAIMSKLASKYKQLVRGYMGKRDEEDDIQKRLLTKYRQLVKGSFGKRSGEDLSDLVDESQGNLHQLSKRSVDNRETDNELNFKLSVEAVDPGMTDSGQDKFGKSDADDRDVNPMLEVDKDNFETELLQPRQQRSLFNSLKYWIDNYNNKILNFDRQRLSRGETFSTTKKSDLTETDEKEILKRVLKSFSFGRFSKKSNADESISEEDVKNALKSFSFGRFSKKNIHDDNLADDEIKNVSGDEIKNALKDFSLERFSKKNINEAGLSEDEIKNALKGFSFGRFSKKNIKDESLSEDEIKSALKGFSFGRLSKKDTGSSEEEDIARLLKSFSFGRVSKKNINATIPDEEIKKVLKGFSFGRYSKKNNVDNTVSDEELENVLRGGFSFGGLRKKSSQKATNDEKVDIFKNSNLENLSERSPKVDFTDDIEKRGFEDQEMDALLKGMNFWRVMKRASSPIDIKRVLNSFSFAHRLLKRNSSTDNLHEQELEEAEMNEALKGKGFWRVLKRSMSENNPEPEQAITFSKDDESQRKRTPPYPLMMNLACENCNTLDFKVLKELSREAVARLASPNKNSKSDMYLGHLIGKRFGEYKRLNHKLLNIQPWHYNVANKLIELENYLMHATGK